MLLSVENICLRYSSSKEDALKQLDLSIESGELIALLGHSGSGKSSLLRVIAGLENPQLGTIKLNDQVLFDAKTNLSPNKRKLGMVFQDYALFPHMTVAKNIGYGIAKKDNKKQKIEELLQLVGLVGMSDRFPHELSGGEQQRVALARALAPQPLLLLLDEPFSNLDEALKDRVRAELKAILKASKTTAILVTHDIRDAMSTADRIAVLNKGALEQIDSPFNIYNYPKTSYVARFFTKVNIFNNNNICILEALSGMKVNIEESYSVHPEHIEFLSEGNDLTKANVIEVRFLGLIFEYVLSINSMEIIAQVPANKHKKLAENEKVFLHIVSQNIHRLG